MEISEEKSRQQKNEKPRQLRFLNPEKIVKGENYYRKHTKVNRHKMQGKNKIQLRDERSEY
ncbi:MAG: hypothetical protein ACP5NZ_01690 [Nanobdellota archaeon]